MIKSPSCPRLRLCYLHLHRRLCRPFPSQGSFRLGPSVAKLPLLASLRPPWTMVSLARILPHPPSHDQPPRRASRACLGSPRLQMFLPGPPSTPPRLCRFGPRPMRPPLLRPCLVHFFLHTFLGVPALQPLSPRYTVIGRNRFDRICRGILSDWAREQRAEPECDADFKCLFLGSSRSSPTISSFTYLAPHKRPLPVARRTLLSR